MKKFERIILSLIAVALLGILGTLFIEKIEIKDIDKLYIDYDSLNINDRENGICADMYAEGFEWGLAQYKIDFQTMFLGHEYMSDDNKAIEWYEFWNDVVMQDNL